MQLKILNLGRSHIFDQEQDERRKKKLLFRGVLVNCNEKPDGGKQNM